MKLFDSHEVYRYVADGGKLVDKKKLLMNAKELKDSVLFELQQELRKRKKPYYAYLPSEREIYDVAEKNFREIDEFIEQYFDLIDAGAKLGMMPKQYKPFYLPFVLQKLEIWWKTRKTRRASGGL